MFCKITTTTDKKDIVDKLSKTLLEKKYSPCIQVTNPIKSQYFWDGKINSASEYRIDIKTLESLSNQVITLIKSLHNYKVPEITSSLITIKNKEYEKWLLENTKR